MALELDAPTIIAGTLNSERVTLVVRCDPDALSVSQAVAAIMAQAAPCPASRVMILDLKRLPGPPIMSEITARWRRLAEEL